MKNPFRKQKDYAVVPMPKPIKEKVSETKPIAKLKFSKLYKMIK